MNIKKNAITITKVAAAVAPALYFFTLLGRTEEARRGLQAQLNYYKEKNTQLLNLVEQDSPETMVKFMQLLTEDDEFFTIWENMRKGN